MIRITQFWMDKKKDCFICWIVWNFMYHKDLNLISWSRFIILEIIQCNPSRDYLSSIMLAIDWKSISLIILSDRYGWISITAGDMQILPLFFSIYNVSLVYYSRTLPLFWIRLNRIIILGLYKPIMMEMFTQWKMFILVSIN